jgi:hypothetical protein
VAGEKALPWKMQSDRLTVVMAAVPSQIERVLAENHVRFEPVDSGSNTNVPWKLNCDRMTLQMAAGRTNQIAQVLAENNVCIEQTATTRGTGTNALWKLNCEQARLRLNENQQIEEAIAVKDVRLTQLTTNEQIAWLLQSDQASLKMAASNRIEQVTAEQNVRLEQRGTNTAPLKLQCGNMAMDLSVSNTVKKILARIQVVVEQGASRATGETGIFEGDRNEVQLRGNPQLLYVDEKSASPGQPPQQIHVSGAEVLIWDRISNHFRGKGQYRIMPKSPLKLERK